MEGVVTEADVLTAVAGVAGVIVLTTEVGTNTEAAIKDWGIYRPTSNLSYLVPLEKRREEQREKRIFFVFRTEDHVIT